MESKNKNTANQKQSSTLLTFLSLCAITTSTTTMAFEQQSKNHDFARATEQQSLSLDSINRLDKNASAVLEEIDLEREWESILGDESEQELLAYDLPGL